MLRKFFIILLSLFVVISRGQKQDLPPSWYKKTDSLKSEITRKKHDTLLVKLLTKIGNRYMNISTDSAKKYFLLAQQKVKGLNYKSGEASVYRVLGILSKNTGNYEDAIAYHLKSAKLNEEIGNKTGLAGAYGNIGQAHVVQRNYDKAEEYIKKAFATFEEAGDKNGQATCLANLGNIQNFRGLPDKALELNLKALGLYKEIKSDVNVAICYADIGGIYYAKKEFQKCFENAKKARELFIKLGNKNGICATDVMISQSYSSLRNAPEALKYVTEADQMATEMGAKSLLRDVYQAYVEAYSAKGDHSMVMKYLKEMVDINIVLSNQASDEKIAEMEAKYHTEKKDKEILLLNKDKILAAKEINEQKIEAEKRNFQRNAFIAGFILVSVLALFIFGGFRQKQKANKIIAEQKKEVEEKNKEVSDSIKYAKRIQEVILPDITIGKDYFADSFILFKPKDIVSGDFYWYNMKGGKKLVAAVDCTGHGVPGALMSMIGNAFLNEVVNEKNILKPSDILSELRNRIKSALKQTGEVGESKDGMDMALLCFNNDNSKVEFAGANNPLWLLRNNSGTVEFTEYTPDKRPVGYYIGKSLPFTNTEIELRKGDTLYIFTDGYADQFGGPKGKKFKYKQLQELLISGFDKPLTEQKQTLEKAFNHWKGSLEQIDDVCVIGIKI